MTNQTPQQSAWSGEFGAEYTDRNAGTLQESDARYRKNFGLTRLELNERFLGGLDRSLRILEVGANVGLQLRFLQAMGFTELYGIELQSYAVEKAKARGWTKGVNLITGSAFDIPFKDAYFDLVFTSGVLIHISPADLPAALAEIHRCTKGYIWGFEYFAETCTQVEYRGREELLWKQDFARLYLDTFPDLELVKEERVPYLTSDNVDSMYLLRKTGK